MRCSKCGADITDTSGKCPHCWTKSSTPKEKPAQPGYRKPILIAMAVLAVLGIASLILASVFKNRHSDITYAPALPSGYDNTLLNSRQNQQPQGNVIGITPPDLSGSNILQAPEASPVPGQSTPSNDTKPKPPQYLLDYLNFVKGVEEHRQRLLKDTQAAFLIGSATKATGGLDSLLNMMDDTDSGQVKDPLEDTKNELVRQYQNWNNTLTFFGSRQPPQECREFAAYYQMVLYNETASIYEIINTLGAATDYNKQEVTQIASALQGILKAGAQKNIDTSADNADMSLTNLVSNYDMQKPFNVSREQGSGGSLLGF